MCNSEQATPHRPNIENKASGKKRKENTSGNLTSPQYACKTKTHIKRKYKKRQLPAGILQPFADQQRGRSTSQMPRPSRELPLNQPSPKRTPSLPLNPTPSVNPTTPQADQQILFGVWVFGISSQPSAHPTNAVKATCIVVARPRSKHKFGAPGCG